jgi:putative transposase
MARTRRDTEAGLFHVWSHSVRSTELFRDDLDRSRFVSELARATQRVGWRCIGFCLLTTHDHLILEVRQGELPVGMQELNFRYASGYNARHGLRGHVFAARYGCRRVEIDHDLPERELQVVFRYVMQNPLKAGLCRSPELWPWSSYASTVGLAESFTFVDASPLLGCFGGSPRAQMAALRAYVEES